jgi:hypothetical protein
VPSALQRCTSQIAPSVCRCGIVVPVSIRKLTTNHGVSSEQPQLQLRFAPLGGGIYVSGPTESYIANVTVPVASFIGGNGTQSIGGVWARFDSGPTITRDAVVPFAMNGWSQRRGGGNSNAAEDSWSNPEAAALAALPKLFQLGVQTKLGIWWPCMSEGEPLLCSDKNRHEWIFCGFEQPLPRHCWRRVSYSSRCVAWRPAIPVRLLPNGHLPVPT